MVISNLGRMMTIMTIKRKEIIHKEDTPSIDPTLSTVNHRHSVMEPPNQSSLKNLQVTVIKTAVPMVSSPFIRRNLPYRKKRPKCRIAIFKLGLQLEVKNGHWDGKSVLLPDGRHCSPSEGIMHEIRLMVAEGLFREIEADYPRWLAACTHPKDFREIMRDLVEHTNRDREVG